MAVHTFDFRKVKPAAPGQRRDYIKPGTYRFKVIAYDDKSSAAGKEMHAFSSTVITKGDQEGKKITDRFAMPKTARESQYPVERLLAFFIACGINAEGKKANLDPNKIKGKTFTAEVYDKQEEMRKVGDTTYPARVVSELQYGVEEDEDEDADEEDEDEEDEEEDEEDEEDEEEDADDEDEEEEDEDEEDEEEEEEEPAPRKSSKTAAKPAAKAAVKKPAAKAAAAAPAKKGKKSKDDDGDFPFD